MLKAYEILGTDKPIFKDRKAEHFFLDELVHLKENPKNYSVVGYVQVMKFQSIFFKPVYSLTKSYLNHYDKGNFKREGDKHVRIIRFPQKNV